MKRIVYLVLGFIFVFLGTLGVILPVMPGVIFFVGAAYFFSYSSETMHKFLYKIPYIGNAILEWDINRTMTLRAKFSLVMLFFGMAVYPYFLMKNKAYAIVMTNFFFICLFTVAAIGSVPKNDSTEASQ